MLELYQIAIDAYKALLPPPEPEQSPPATVTPSAAEPGTLNPDAEQKPAGKPEPAAVENLSLQPDAKAEADALLPGWMKEPPKERKRKPAEANPEWEDAVKEMVGRPTRPTVKLMDFDESIPAGQISITEEVEAGETVERC